MDKQLFGIDKNGNEIYRYTLTDEKGNSLSVLNYGATIQSLIITDKNGVKKDVVLGFDNLEQYEDDTDRTYFGAVCGRVANRIANGEFYIEGEKYTLVQNNNGHCLHGGKDGFDKKFFDLTDAEDDYMTFSTFSMDGEEGFPGNLSLSVKYTLRNGLLMIEYLASTTATCPVSLSNHTYFNLAGEGDIRSHRLQLNSHYYMEVDENVLTTGMVLPVKGTEFDFTTEKELGPAIDAAATAQPAVKGIDHHFFCDNALSEYRRFGTLSAPDGSLKMDIFTNQCGAQIYTANFTPQMPAKDRQAGRNCGIAIETQYPPNNLNFSHLPNMLLHRGETYYHKTGFRFYY
ncbi:MAG: galactose mutarotase [Oscillospiraceae bacterium]|nr:galactose mutarotase [Oscillospiraceae bacterium]